MPTSAVFLRCADHYRGRVSARLARRIGAVSQILRVALDDNQRKTDVALSAAKGLAGEGVLTAAPRAKHDSRRRVTLRYGAGQGRIRLETFSGDIRVLMLDPKS